MVQNTKRFVKSGPIGFPAPEIIEEEVLKDGTFVRKVARTVLVDHKTTGRRVESLVIDEYRKKRKVEGWPETATTRIYLEHDAVHKLLNYLLLQKQFLSFQRSTTYTLLVGAKELSDLKPAELNALISLVQHAVRRGNLSELVAPETVDNFTAAIQQARYKGAIDQLREMLAKPGLSEDTYRKWFLRHHWVFGTEYVGPEEGTKIGWDSKGDIILRSVDGYQDLIELKLPTVPILNNDQSHDNWYPSSDLAKAVAQVIKYFQETEDVRMVLAEKEKLPFLKPRARIVIGRSNEWSQDRFDALRRLNASLQNIQIMTYDHLISSADRMVRYYEREDAVP